VAEIFYIKEILTSPVKFETKSTMTGTFVKTSVLLFPILFYILEPYYAIVAPFWGENAT
jgi:hypothetical protein